MPKVYYYGCIGASGHYFFGPGPSHAYARREVERRLMELFGTLYLAPGPRERDRYNFVRDEHQTEGHAALVYAGGWTALSFWDRSVDRRHGCVSTFLAEGTYDAPAMLKTCGDAFPRIWSRYSFEVRVVELPKKLVRNETRRCVACGCAGYSTDMDIWHADPAGWLRSDRGLVCSVACALESDRRVRGMK